MTSSFKGTYFKRDVALVDQSIDLSKSNYDLYETINAEGAIVIDSKTIDSFTIKSISIECVNAHINEASLDLVLSSSERNGVIKLVADITPNGGQGYENACILSTIPVKDQYSGYDIGCNNYLGYWLFGNGETTYDLIFDEISSTVIDESGETISAFDDVKVSYDFSKIAGALISVNTVGYPDVTFNAISFENGTTDNHRTPINISTKGFNSVSSTSVIPSNSLIQVLSPLQTTSTDGDTGTVTNSGGGIVDEYTPSGSSEAQKGFELTGFYIEATKLDTSNGTKLVISEGDDIGNFVFEANILYYGTDQARSVTPSGGDPAIQEPTSKQDVRFVIPVTIGQDDNNEVSFTLQKSDYGIGYFLPSSINRVISLNDYVPTVDVSGTQTELTDISFDVTINLGSLSDVYIIPNVVDATHVDVQFADTSLRPLSPTITNSDVTGGQTENKGAVIQTIEIFNISFNISKLDFGFISQALELGDGSFNSASVSGVKFNLDPTQPFYPVPKEGSSGVANVSSIAINGGFKLDETNTLETLTITPSIPFKVPVKLGGEGYILYTDDTNDLKLQGANIVDPESEENPPEVLVYNPTFVIFYGRELKIVETSTSNQYDLIFTDPITHRSDTYIGFSALSKTTLLENKLHFKDSAKATAVDIKASNLIYNKHELPFRIPALEVSADAGFIIPKINSKNEVEGQHIYISDLVREIQEISGKSLIPHESERLHALEVALAYTTSDELESGSTVIGTNLAKIKAHYSVLEPEPLDGV